MRYMFSDVFTYQYLPIASEWIPIDRIDETGPIYYKLRNGKRQPVSEMQELFWAIDKLQTLPLEQKYLESKALKSKLHDEYSHDYILKYVMHITKLENTAKDYTRYAIIYKGELRSVYYDQKKFYTADSLISQFAYNIQALEREVFSQKASPMPSLVQEQFFASKEMLGEPATQEDIESATRDFLFHQGDPNNVDVPGTFGLQLLKKLNEKNYLSDAVCRDDRGQIRTPDALQAILPKLQYCDDGKILLMVRGEIASIDQEKIEATLGVAKGCLRKIEETDSVHYSIPVEKIVPIFHRLGLGRTQEGYGYTALSLDTSLLLQWANPTKHRHILRDEEQLFLVERNAHETDRRLTDFNTSERLKLTQRWAQAIDTIRRRSENPSAFPNTAIMTDAHTIASSSHAASSNTHSAPEENENTYDVLTELLSEAEEAQYLEQILKQIQKRPWDEQWKKLEELFASEERLFRQSPSEASEKRIQRIEAQIDALLDAPPSSWPTDTKRKGKQRSMDERQQGHAA